MNIDLNFDILLTLLIFHGDICEVNFGTYMILRRICATKQNTDSENSCDGKGIVFLNEIENVVRFVNVKYYQ